jgi:hypothetical protein
MDFFDNSYINERQVDDLKIYSKRKISKEEFSASLFKKFLNICVEFPHVNYVMYTSYRNVTNVSLPNLSIIRMPK